jgi:hypothetical protein
MRGLVLLMSDGGHDEVQRDGMFGLDEIADTPVTARSDGGDDRIAIEPKK